MISFRSRWNAGIGLDSRTPLGTVASAHLSFFECRHQAKGRRFKNSTGHYGAYTVGHKKIGRLVPKHIAGGKQ